MSNQVVVLSDSEHRNVVVLNVEHIVSVKPYDPYRPAGKSLVIDVLGHTHSIYESVDEVYAKMNGL